MIFTELEPPPLILPHSPGRSEGVHASAIIRCLALESSILNTDELEELSLADARSITDPIALLRICLGLAWEQWYLPTILSRYGVLDHPGEMKRDGIYLTHDGESLDVLYTLPDGRPQYGIVVYEVKCTWKSTKRSARLDKEYMWMWQLMAYCKARGTLRGVMDIYHVNGNYSYPLRPQHKLYQVDFTQNEVDNNWNTLHAYKLGLEKRIENEGRLWLN